jgi:hypothetical protein
VTTACESSERTMGTEGPKPGGSGVNRLRVAEMHPGALQFVLEADAVRSFRVGRRPMEVACISGELWVTVEGDPEDHFLGAGETLSVGRWRLIVMTALGTSRVRIVRGRTTGPADASTLTSGARGAGRWSASPRRRIS